MPTQEEIQKILDGFEGSKLAKKTDNEIDGINKRVSKKYTVLTQLMIDNLNCTSIEMIDLFMDTGLMISRRRASSEVSYFGQIVNYKFKERKLKTELGINLLKQHARTCTNQQMIGLFQKELGYTSQIAAANLLLRCCKEAGIKPLTQKEALHIFFTKHALTNTKQQMIELFQKELGYTSESAKTKIGQCKRELGYTLNKSTRMYEKV